MDEKVAEKLTLTSLDEKSRLEIDRWYHRFESLSESMIWNDFYTRCDFFLWIWTFFELLFWVSPLLRSVSCFRLLECSFGDWREQKWESVRECERARVRERKEERKWTRILKESFVHGREWERKSESVRVVISPHIGWGEREKTERVYACASVCARGSKGKKEREREKVEVRVQRWEKRWGKRLAT